MYNTELPMGLGMALMQNRGAMEYFASLPRETQRSIIERTHSINSKSEMRSYVASLPTSSRLS